MACGFRVGNCKSKPTANHNLLVEGHTDAPENDEPAMRQLLARAEVLVVQWNPPVS